MSWHLHLSLKGESSISHLYSWPSLYGYRATFIVYIGFCFGTKFVLYLPTELLQWVGVFVCECVCLCVCVCLDVCEFVCRCVRACVFVCV